MKKVKTLFIVLLIFLLAGCGKTNINNPQDDASTTNNTSANNIESKPSQNEISNGIDIKNNKIFFYNEEKGFVDGNKLNIKLDGWIISFDGNPANITFGEPAGATNFYYNNLEISDQAKCPYAICKPVNEVNYKCDGPLIYKKNGDPAPNYYCETNGKDSLTQYEFSPANGNGFATGGEYDTKWYKLYIKKFGNKNIFFFGNLKGDTYYLDDSKKREKLSQKTYLDEILRDEENRKRIAEWNKIVENVSYKESR